MRKAWSCDAGGGAEEGLRLQQQERVGACSEIIQKFKPSVSLLLLTL